MTDGVPVQMCAACGRRFFPHRLACAGCGKREFTIDVVTEGTVEETTAIHRAPGRELDAPVRIATVVLGVSPRIVARVGVATEPGESVRLRVEGGAPVAY
jgi:uncharacterized OB-fold protein